MIELSQVYKRFGIKIAVSDLTFKASQGDIVGFLGPNGAGKTTTMRLITGFLKPTEGKIRIFGEDPITSRLSLLPRIGYLPENNPLPGDMTFMKKK